MAEINGSVSMGIIVLTFAKERHIHTITALLLLLLLF
jgi:hypothetical protein